MSQPFDIKTLWQNSSEVALIGILNVTPDSFSDGGSFNILENALIQAQKMQSEGAHILDIGGESTRPNAAEVFTEEEITRVVPIISALASTIRIPMSIDTYKARTAEQALRAGVKIVNDVWGMQRDPEMAAIVAHYNAAVVMMHNRQVIDPDIAILDDILRFFEHSLTLAQNAGIPKEHIILDPGIGFGKTQYQNMDALRNIKQLKSLGYPILIGASKKSFIGHITGNPVDERLAGTLAVHLYAVQQGADIIRIHDVKEHKDALRILNVLETGQIQ